MPEGDYILTVVGFAQRISTGAKTNGSTLYAVDFAMEPEGAATDALIDAPSSAWKIDNFLKACGVAIAKGTDFEFLEGRAMDRNVLWVNPYGLRCRAHVVVEEFTTRNGARMKANKVGAYLEQGKKKLERMSQEDLENLENILNLQTTEDRPTETDTRPF